MSEQETKDRTLEAITMALMPFLMLGAGDDPIKAKAAVATLVLAYNPRDIQEIDLAARIVGFSLAALDNLRRSMAKPDLPDTKVLGYRSSAVSLGRSAEQCRAVLRKFQEQPKQTPQVTQTPKPLPAKAEPAKLPGPLPPISNAQMEKAKAEARAMLNGLAKLGATSALGQGMTGIRMVPDAGAKLTAELAIAVAEKKLQTAAQAKP